jgi:Multiubiquitin
MNPVTDGEPKAAEALGGPNDHTKPDKTFEIVVNTREETVQQNVVTFEQIVKLAFPTAQAEANVKYSMTYRNAASKPHAGELGEGGSVEVKNHGTIFNVTKTVQS